MDAAQTKKFMVQWLRYRAVKTGVALEPQGEDYTVGRNGRSPLTFVPHALILNVKMPQPFSHLLTCRNQKLSSVGVGVAADVVAEAVADVAAVDGVARATGTPAGRRICKQ